jgi:hypothetical protein
MPPGWGLRWPSLGSVCELVYLAAQQMVPDRLRWWLETQTLPRSDVSLQRAER